MVQRVGGDPCIDQAPVFQTMPQRSRLLQIRSTFLHILLHLRTIFRYVDISDPHAQKLPVCVAIARDSRVVDLEESERVQIVDPHRERASHEQGSEAFLVVRAAWCFHLWWLSPLGSRRILTCSTWTPRPIGAGASTSTISAGREPEGDLAVKLFHPEHHKVRGFLWSLT